MTAIGGKATPAELARLAAAGDEAAFRRLVDVYNREVAGLCYTITRDTDLAAEAAQSTWVKAWLRLSSLRDPDRMHAWLCAIAVNEARRLLRARRRATIVPLEVAADIEYRERRFSATTPDIDLARALSRLSPDDRTLLGLRYVAGLNATELAESLHMTPSGTRARLARLLRRLREELTDA
jgi:RNA polymerase sigma factor (sigma-70 family)